MKNNLLFIYIKTILTKTEVFIMIEFFLGVIAIVLIIAFWEKIKPVLEGVINALINIIVIAPFKLIFSWIKGFVFTFKALWITIKYSWKNHKILFITATLLFLCLVLLDYVPEIDDKMWLWLIKYICGAGAFLLSVIFSFSATQDHSNKDFLKITDIKDIAQNDNLIGMVISYSALLLYLIYFIFGIYFATNLYFALFLSFMIIWIIVQLKNLFTNNNTKK